jgi:hypothetical protein
MNWKTTLLQYDAEQSIAASEGGFRFLCGNPYRDGKNE